MLIHLMMEIRIVTAIKGVGCIAKRREKGGREKHILQNGTALFRCFIMEAVVTERQAKNEGIKKARKCTAHNF